MAAANLRCSTCGVHPTELEAKHTAREGGTHYRIVEHGVGIPGRRKTRNARKCGTWVLAQAPRSDRDFPGVPGYLKKP